jgi:hypothetical protein
MTAVLPADRVAVAEFRHPPCPWSRCCSGSPPSPSASPWSGTSPRSVGLAAAVVGIIERRIVELERELGIPE